MAQFDAGTKFGSYQIVGNIGGGGMAQIYLAKTEGLAGFEKYLALKVINPEYANEDRFIEMLINEAKISVGLSHVNIAQVFDLGECAGTYYIAMEYIDGVDILELVNGLHALGEYVPVEAAAYIARQICSGLHYAHMRKDRSGKPLNVVHRDISPQNVLVSRAGEVKVVDFGIAKAAGVSSKTQAGVIKGKVNYMAPEQVTGEEVDARTDIFAVGIVMWEMLTSQMVYAGDNMRELASRVRKADIPAPSSIRSGIPNELDRIVLHALHPDRRKRLQTAHDLQIELTKFLSALAPEYGGSNLARLVERLGSGKLVALQREPSQVLSQEDQLEDRNSLIFRPTGHAHLIVQFKDRQETLPLGSELTIGRAGQLALPDVRVSRQHARIKRETSGYFIEDLGSSNGTYVNAAPVVGRKRLDSNDRIQVGNCEIVFKQIELSEVSSARDTSEKSSDVPDPQRSKARNSSAPSSSEHDSGALPPLSDVLAQSQQSSPTNRHRPVRVTIDTGLSRIEHTIESTTEVSYAAHLGPIRLTGVCCAIAFREGDCWLDPKNDDSVSSGKPRRDGDPHRNSRALVRHNGKDAESPIRLKNGDTFSVADTVFSISKD